MDRVNIERAMNMLEQLNALVGYEDFTLAMFMWVRYGELLGTEEELKKIMNIIDSYDTLFNIDMEYDIEDVLDKYQE